MRTRISVQDVAADPTNAYEVTVHGDVAIKSLAIRGEGSAQWVAVEYANGGTCTGTPAHWATYVRITEGSCMNLSEMPEVGQRVAINVAFYDSADETAERVGSLIVQATVTRVWTNGRYVTVKTDPYIASDNGAEISRIFTRIYSELLEV